MNSIPLESLPEALRPRVGPDAPAPMRMMIARALLPMPPVDLFTSLAYLVSNEPGELSETALKSLKDMPAGVIGNAIKETSDPSLLEFALREFVDDDPKAQAALLNGATPDETVEWAARRVSGKLVELIGNNQERIIRHPPLVEAIYFNPEAPMRVVSRVFETGIREGLDLSHIPGFSEIYASIFGDEAGKKLEDAERTNRGDIDNDLVAGLLADLPPEEALPDFSDDVGGIAEDEFSEAMKRAAEEDDEDAADGTKEEKTSKKPLHALVKDMSIGQKIRLGLVGNKTARGLLIKDPKPIVALAVLKSPQITVDEVATFAKNKSISERVIMAIARNGKWVKMKQIQLSLVRHPKTPAAMSNRWVRALSERELKDLARSRDVPGQVSRLAKNLLSQRRK